jgi:hypothetical protein
LDTKKNVGDRLMLMLNSHCVLLYNLLFLVTAAISIPTIIHIKNFKLLCLDFVYNT